MVKINSECGCEEFESQDYECGCIHCPRCEEWVTKEDHQGYEFDNGVCWHCSCEVCGKRLDHDDLNDNICEHCMEVEIMKTDLMEAQGICTWCKKAKATEYIRIDDLEFYVCKDCFDK